MAKLAQITQLTGGWEMSTVMVTGGAGFIGSNFVRYFLEKYPDYNVVVYDNLTYAGNTENLSDLEENPRFHFVPGDILSARTVRWTIKKYGVDAIVNFAGNTHVDRSIGFPATDFVQTNMLGPYHLLEVAREVSIRRFVQVSTDEVYGQITAPRLAREEDSLNPRNTYSVSKAGGDLMALAYHQMHNIPVMVTRGSNTFGPYQYIEKLIPFFIVSALNEKPLPIYGKGDQIRDWTYVLDHCSAIDLVLHKGEPGQIYNVGSGNEVSNIDLTQRILDILHYPHSLIKHVSDRPGHDQRYALDTSKIRSLGWKPAHDFNAYLEKTVLWYVENRKWWEKIFALPEFQDYYNKQYERRI